MGKKQIIVKSVNKGWKVSSIKKTYSTRAEAVSAGARAGRRSGNAELVVHRTDGTIGEKRTYGPDPFPPKG